MFIVYRVTGAMTMKYSAVLVALVLVAAGASSEPAPQALPAPVAPEMIQERTWNGLGLQADVNDYVDNTIGLLVPFIQKYGLDPMPLPTVEEGFSVRPLLITYSAWLRIHDGYMTGLVNVARNGDQMVNYFAKMLRVRVELQFRDLEIRYRYLVQAMGLGPTGGIVGSLARFIVTVDLLIDFNNDEVHLQEFSLSDIGRLRVRFTGNILTDWLVNPVLNVFVRIFDTIIIRVIESTIRSAVQSALSFVNAGLGDILDHIESINAQSARAALNIANY